MTTKRHSDFRTDLDNLPSTNGESEDDAALTSQVEELRAALETRDDRGRRSASAAAARTWRSLGTEQQGRFVRLLSGLWDSHFLARNWTRLSLIALRLQNLGKRAGLLQVQAEGLLAEGILNLAEGEPQDALKKLDLSRALFSSTESNPLDSVRASIPLVSAYLLTGDRDSALSTLLRARSICLRFEEPFLLAAVLQTLGILYLETGDLKSALACFEQVVKSSQVLSSRKRMIVRGQLGLALAHLRTGDCDKARTAAKHALESSIESDLFRETALAHEYLGMIAQSRGDASRAIRHYLQVSHLISTSPKATDLRTELHLRLAQLWISKQEAHYSELHIRKGLKNVQGAEAEDIAELQRCKHELLRLKGDAPAALVALQEHEDSMREKGLGYQQLLTAGRIAMIAEETGNTELASTWWSKIRFLAKVCGAERLKASWEAETQSSDSPVPMVSSKLAAELPQVELHRFGIITKSARIYEQGAWIGRIAPTTLPILIRGESGTGKELFALLVHTLSDRKENEFVALNCGALPGELLESELFGYRRGAFTGAVGDKAGLFRSAHKGTIFLDEIGEMSPAAQTKLLRVLESGEFRPVGETRVETVDVRVVAATNVDLEKAVHNGVFRRDLYYRLKGLEISLPPLRERVGDIPALADHFLEQAAASHGKRLSFPFETRQWLMGQPWRGNVRELKLAVERAAALAPDSGYVQEYHFSTDGSQRRVSLDEELQSIERERVRHAIEAADWNVTAAAEMLHLSRTTLSGRLKKFGLKRPV